MPESFLDTDLYKLTMQQAIAHCGLDAPVRYRLICRKGPIHWPPEAVRIFESELEAFRTLRLTQAEQAFLASTGYFHEKALDALVSYRFEPHEVSWRHDPQTGLQLTVQGPWWRTILWETPLLATICAVTQAHARPPADLDRFRERTRAKALRWGQCGQPFVEFGTRRRHSAHAQRACLEILRESAGGSLSGTSNLHFARLLGLPPSGTIAHEWFMVHACLQGVDRAETSALDHWLEVYPGEQTIALTDTLTSAHFFRRTPARLARSCAGLRHDSGDPAAFIEQALAWYARHHVDPLQKRLVFSDGLDDHAAHKIAERVGGRAQVAFGLGTWLTHDFPESPALDVVLKLDAWDGLPTVKLSDDPGKETGSPEAIAKARQIVNTP